MQKGFAPVLVLVGIVVIVVVAAGAYLKLANSDFENCKKMSDSRILESSPPGCQTPDGKIFNEKTWRTLLLLMKRSEPISQTPQPTPVVSSSPDETANWKTYTNTKYGYLVKYPPRSVLQEDSSNDVYLNFVSFEDLTTDKNFTISVRNTKLEKEIEFLKWSVEGHILYTLDGEESLNFQNYPGARLSYRPQKPNEESPFTYFTVNNKYSYTLKADTDEIDQILSTFRFDSLP